MQITEVRISLKEVGNRKLKAFATVTFDDDFVVRDIKIIEGRQGLFVAMPSARVMENCPTCGRKNPVRSSYCSECGAKLPVAPQVSDPEERREEHRDICHPVRPEFRQYVESQVISAYMQKVGTGAAHFGRSSM
ncbi:MAG: SpoVG family protein [Verrucomicrobia bacterium]|nr:SpoVG family protein [Verrucomicrobiota bacterium]